MPTSAASRSFRRRHSSEGRLAADCVSVVCESAAATLSLSTVSVPQDLVAALMEVVACGLPRVLGGIVVEVDARSVARRCDDGLISGCLRGLPLRRADCVGRGFAGAAWAEVIGRADVRVGAEVGGSGVGGGGGCVAVEARPGEEVDERHAQAVSWLRGLRRIGLPIFDAVRHPRVLFPVLPEVGVARAPRVRQRALQDVLHRVQFPHSVDVELLRRLRLTLSEGPCFQCLTAPPTSFVRSASEVQPDRTT